MSILGALDECLTYIRRCASAFDEATLLTSLKGSGSDPQEGDFARTATALRSRALMPFAKVLSEYETFVGADLSTELATF